MFLEVLFADMIPAVRVAKRTAELPSTDHDHDDCAAEWYREATAALDAGDRDAVLRSLTTGTTLGEAQVLGEKGLRRLYDVVMFCLDHGCG